MWIARNKNGVLRLFNEKPVRTTMEYRWHFMNDIWLSRDYNCGSLIVFNTNLFPELTWDDEPIEVTLVENKHFNFKLSEDAIKVIEKETGKTIEQLRSEPLNASASINNEANYHLMKCKRYYSPFDKGGDNDFNKGFYYKVNLKDSVAEDDEGIRWKIDNISDYFTELNFIDKIIRKIFYH